jgi:hypothetical protein
MPSTNLNDYRLAGLPPQFHDYCVKCDAYHDKRGRLRKSALRRSPPAPSPLRDKYAICQKCGGLLGTNGHGIAPCAIRAKSLELCRQGWISTRRPRDGHRRGSGDDWWNYVSNSPARHAYKMLIALEQPARLELTARQSTTLVPECWTTPEGLDLLLLMQHIAGWMTVVVPEAVRRVLRNPAAIAEFRALYNMDAPTKVLLKFIETEFNLPPETKHGKRRRRRRKSRR